jgi:hypothetical protein
MVHSLDCSARAGQERRVAHPLAPTLAQELRAIDAWWRDAGVDHVFADAPINWLAEPEDEAVEDTPAVERQPAAAPKPPELLAGGPENWPATLAAFDDWWLDEPALALGPHRRVAAQGPAEAPLMVLVGQPVTDDAETLLSGQEGALLANMLAASVASAASGLGRARPARLGRAHPPPPRPRRAAQAAGIRPCRPAAARARSGARRCRFPRSRA